VEFVPAVLKGDGVALARLLEGEPTLFPRYNIAPSQPVFCVGLSRDGKPAPALFRWGLVPGWATDARKAPINARAETAARKPTFAAALRKRRCLVPATGFYEWEQLPGRRKRPWYFRLAGGGLFAFAGHWEAWRPPSGPPPLTCARLTAAANDVVKPVHRRMALILPPEAYAAWTDRGLEEVADLLRPLPAGRMKAFPVGPAVNDPRHEGPECLAAAHRRGGREY
jgi:putative SOS response-associated peptidase YedK